MKKNKQKKGFTLIESMIVLFIIGLLTFIAALGYGKANRQKELEQSARKVNSETTSVRDYSVFGQEVNNKYPCGYGIAIGKSKSEIKDVYTSGANMDRISAADNNQTCDELINNKDVALSAIPTDDPDSLSLKKVSISRIDKINNGSIAASDLGCLVVLFSSPRSMAYYCSSSGASCPPASCTFKIFSESADLNSDLFLTTLLLQEGFNSNKAYIRTYPSGNSEIVQE